jgi:signal transduction histidine kinase
MCGNGGRRIVRGVSGDRPASPGIEGLRQQQARLEAVRRWRLRLGPALIISLAALAAFQNRPGPPPGLAGRGLAVSAALTVFALACLGVQRTARRPGGGYLTSSAVVVASSAVLLWAQPTGPGHAGVFIGVLLIALRLPWRAALGLSASALVVLAVIAQLTGAGIAGEVPVMVAFGGFFGMMYMADRLGEANIEAEGLLTELERSRAAAASAAERQRLAREMHDVLAHSLSGLMLQLEGARMLAADDPTDARLPAAIDRAHQLAKTGMEEARRAIGMLRGDELPGPERLADLAAQFSRDRGIPCRLTVAGEEQPLSSQAGLALYRAAQEALTNIARHAQPGCVEIHLRYGLCATRLTVEDFAPAGGIRPVPAGGDGYGLTGMRERAELLGGTLTTKATCAGFLVELEVPA